MLRLGCDVLQHQSAGFRAYAAGRATTSCVSTDAERPASREAKLRRDPMQVGQVLASRDLVLDADRHLGVRAVERIKV